VFLSRQLITADFTHGFFTFSCNSGGELSGGCTEYMAHVKESGRSHGSDAAHFGVG